MNTKVFSVKIFRNHYSTFVNEKGDTVLADWLLMLGFPFLIALLMSFKSIDVGDSTLIGMLTLGAILTGLLLNLLVLVYDLKTKHKETEVCGNDPNRKAWARRYKVIEEVHYNIAYAIWISLLGLFMAVAGTFKFKLVIHVPYLDFDLSTFTWLISFPLYLLFSHLLLTIYMILKRVYVLVTG